MDEANSGWVATLHPPFLERMLANHVHSHGLGLGLGGHGMVNQHAGGGGMNRNGNGRSLNLHGHGQLTRATRATTTMTHEGSKPMTNDERPPQHPQPPSGVIAHRVETGSNRGRVHEEEHAKRAQETLTTSLGPR